MTYRDIVLALLAHVHQAQNLLDAQLQHIEWLCDELERKGMLDDAVEPFSFASCYPH